MYLRNSRILGGLQIATRYTSFLYAVIPSTKYSIVKLLVLGMHLQINLGGFPKNQANNFPQFDHKFFGCNNFLWSFFLKRPMDQ